MSLEAALRDATTAINCLVEILTKSGLPTPLQPSPNPNKTVDDSEKYHGKTPAYIAKEAAEAEKKAAAKQPVKSATTKPATPAATPAPAANEAYAPVKAAILAAVAAGKKPQITAMLAEYDAKTGLDLKPESYSEVLEKITVITNGEVDDLA